MNDDVYRFDEVMLVYDRHEDRDVLVDGVRLERTPLGRQEVIPVVIVEVDHVHGGKPTRCLETRDAGVSLPWGVRWQTLGSPDYRLCGQRRG